MELPFTTDDFVQIQPETGYSSPKPEHIPQEIEFFRLHFSHAMKIIDGTAHVGVDTAILAHAIPNAGILAIEIKPKTYEALVENMKRRGLTGIVNTWNGDVVNFINTTNEKVDLFYLDPPWGGPGYKRGISDLPLSGTSLFSITDIILTRVSSNIVIKVPFNFNVDGFDISLKKGRVKEISRISRGGKGPPAFLYLIIEKL